MATTTETTKATKRRKTKKKKQPVLGDPIPIKFNNCNNNAPSTPILIHEDQYPMLFNLAQVPLSQCEKEILNKGLKFCPTPYKINPSDYEEAIENMHRKLLLQAYHIKQNNISTLQANLTADKAFQEKHKKPSTWVPPRH
jgi:hypothetical protein